MKKLIFQTVQFLTLKLLNGKFLTTSHHAYFIVTDDIANDMLLCCSFWIKSSRGRWCSSSFTRISIRLGLTKHLHYIRISPLFLLPVCVRQGMFHECKHLTFLLKKCLASLKYIQNIQSDLYPILFGKRSYNPVLSTHVIWFSNGKP